MWFGARAPLPLSFSFLPFFFFLIFETLFLFYVYECLSECMFVYHMPEEDIKSPRTGITVDYEPPYGF